MSGQPALSLVLSGSEEPQRKETAFNRAVEKTTPYTELSLEEQRIITLTQENIGATTFMGD